LAARDREAYTKDPNKPPYVRDAVHEQLKALDSLHLG
jgi:hypothetical protein